VYCFVAALPPRLSGFSVSELDTLGLPLTTLNKQEVGRVTKHDLYMKLSERQDEDERLLYPDRLPLFALFRLRLMLNLFFDIYSDRRASRSVCATGKLEKEVQYPQRAMKGNNKYRSLS
jgi:hypothetical protein